MKTATHPTYTEASGRSTITGHRGRLRRPDTSGHPRRPHDPPAPRSRRDRAARHGDRLLDKGGAARLPSALERQLVTAAQRGDARARTELVEAFLPLIASVARLYRCTPSVDRLELLQEGVVGLLRAVERYDPARGTPFWAYAKWWVRQAMQQLVSELTRPVVLSDRALRQLARLREARAAALAESGREPSREELAARIGLVLEQVDDLLAIDTVPFSTEEPITSEDGAFTTIGEQLVDPVSEAEYERVLEESEQREVIALLDQLADRERSVLQARYGFDGEPRSLSQIAGRLGVSGERVRQLERRALDKLAVAAGAVMASA